MTASLREIATGISSIANAASAVRAAQRALDAAPRSQRTAARAALRSTARRQRALQVAFRELARGIRFGCGLCGALVGASTGCSCHDLVRACIALRAELLTSPTTSPGVRSVLASHDRPPAELPSPAAPAAVRPRGYGPSCLVAGPCSVCADPGTAPPSPDLAAKLLRGTHVLVCARCFAFGGWIERHSPSSAAWLKWVRGAPRSRR